MGLAVRVPHYYVEARKIGLADLLGFVDNFYALCAPDEAKDQARKLVSMFAEAGIDLHEEMTGTFFKGLGWEWDLVALNMICPVDKFAITSAYLKVWCSAKSLSVKQAQTAVGLLS